jgi:hypothetical protein
MSDTQSQDENVLAVGKERVNINSASNKLISDIEFLKDRIAKMRAFRNPNKETLSTYEEMLKSREAVLHWIEEQKKPGAKVQASQSASSSQG